METKPISKRFAASKGAFDVSAHDADVRRSARQQTAFAGTLTTTPERRLAAPLAGWHRRVDWMLLGALTIFMVIGGLLLALWWVF